MTPREGSANAHQTIYINISQHHKSGMGRWHTY